MNLQDTIDDKDVSWNDPFLNLLCFHNNDKDEVELNSFEDWSVSEQDYDEKVENKYMRMKVLRILVMILIRIGN